MIHLFSVIPAKEYVKEIEVDEGDTLTSRGFPLSRE